MMEIVFGKRFLHAAHLLPKSQQKKLAALLALLQENPFHEQLHTKRLSGDLAGFLSFRTTRDWRVIFQFLLPDSLQLILVGHRKDIYQKMRSLRGRN